jgi:hypothetical protein
MRGVSHQRAERGNRQKGSRVNMRGRSFKTAGACLCVAAALALVAVGLASCGSSGTAKVSKSSTTKLPPGASQEGNSTTAQSTEPSSTPAATQSAPATTPAQQQSKTPSTAADLYGGRFTVVNATRPDTNKSVISSSGREVKGDYLEVEFTIANVATDHLVDLSEYSFRLSSPGIAASTYADYYGTVGTYGAYVDENEISATLLDYSSLSPVAYKVKVGETVTKVFCFFDLNPENVGRNPGVTKDNTSLIIRKVSGTDYGNQVSIPLAGYPD